MPVQNVRQLGATGLGITNDTPALTAAFAAATALVHFQFGAYRLAGAVTIPPGTLTIHGAACWQPANASLLCLDAEQDLGLHGDNMCECSAPLAGFVGAGASAWLHVGSGHYRLASQVTLQPGVLVVAGTLDWAPPPPATRSGP